MKGQPLGNSAKVHGSEERKTSTTREEERCTRAQCARKVLRKLTDQLLRRGSIFDRHLDISKFHLISKFPPVASSAPRPR
eukprot:921361-Pleurochrysis_carterae.AAC.2